eukprot:snap_masked-scaffold_47-processed-gene-1.51-mRNA-1 protein AED:1.00 eAED:1.00 QI:0/-1/0/0/-1/1/1/0/98
MQSSTTGYIFKIAFLASQQYSDYHGATRDSVFSALTTMLSRLNGIYAREFGAFFEFVDNQDLGIFSSAILEHYEARSRISKNLSNTLSLFDAGVKSLL